MQKLKALLALCGILACAFCATGAEVLHIRGIVRDSVSAQGLPYASISVAGSHKGAVADSRGIFELAVPVGTRSFFAFSQGYRKKEIPIVATSHNLYDIYLAPEATELKELVVKKEKYSKKNNPAVDFARRLRKGASLTDPRRNSYYSYDRYERTSFGICNFNPDSASAIMKRFPFLKEHVDTSEISGAPVLNLSVKEKSSQILFRNTPKTEKELVDGFRSRGVDEFVESANVQAVLDDILREVDLYDSDIALLRNSFVSPLSSIAPDFYRFYLVDTVAVEGHPCVVLAFYPRNKASNGFSGHVYVDSSDSTMFIRKVDMHTAADINLNFIRNLTITQNFGRGPDGSRWKLSDDLVIEAVLLPGTPPVYISRKIGYRNHSYMQPDSLDVFDNLGTTIMEEGADKRGDIFWERARLRPEKSGESNIGSLTSRFRKVPLYYWGEKVLRILFTGYVPTSKDSKFDYGPVNTTISYNGLEGIRLRAGGMTTANLSRHWFARGYIARGFRDHRWKYSAELEYSFNEKKYHSREFPVHSLRLTHKYDLDHLGSHYLFTNADNFVLSLSRMSNRKDTYRRLTMLEYTLELANNFSVTASLENIRQQESPYVRFIDWNGRGFGHYTENVVGVKLRYAPGEKFVQTKSYRIPVNEDSPTFTLSHRFAPKGFLGSRFAINKTEFDFSKRFWLSVFGSVDVAVGAGHVWSSSPFPELLIPNANLSYTIQPQSFALMNAMEFVNSTYVSWDLVYRARGALFNLIPGLKKLGLREVVGFRGIYGHLSKRNTPGEAYPDLYRFPDEAGVCSMSRGPYMEISAGLDNILRFLRVDYVWRLSYLDVPYKIDRSGLRVALHFTF